MVMAYEVISQVNQEEFIIMAESDYSDAISA